MFLKLQKILFVKNPLVALHQMQLIARLLNIYYSDEFIAAKRILVMDVIQKFIEQQLQILWRCELNAQMC